MNVSKSLFLTLLLLFSLLLSAGEKPGHIYAWEVTKKGLPGHLTLAGSIHLGKKDFYPLDKAYDLYWDKASILVLEVTDSQDPKVILPFLREFAFYPAGGQDLASVCGQFLYSRLLLFCKPLYPPHLFKEGEFRRKRPWFLTLELAQLQLSRLDYQLEWGVEMIFRQNAGKREIRGLEKTLFQLSTLEKIPEREYLKGLEQLLNDPAREIKDLDNIVRGWRNGEPAVLEKQVLRQKREFPILHEKLLLARNRDMAGKLAAMAAENKRFFVLIGAAHFVGNGSIPALLREKGFTVKKIPATGEKGKITKP